MVQTLEIIKNIELDENKTIYADQLYLPHAALANFFSNAIKFSERNGKIQIDIFESNQQACIQIAGQGM